MFWPRLYNMKDHTRSVRIPREWPFLLLFYGPQPRLVKGLLLLPTLRPTASLPLKQEGRVLRVYLRRDDKGDLFGQLRFAPSGR